MAEYIIISVKSLKRRIKNLENEISVSESLNDKIRAGIETFQKRELEDILSKHKPVSLDLSVLKKLLKFKL